MSNDKFTGTFTILGHVGTRECRHPSASFDRTLCACGAMHDYCDACGVQVDPCGANGNTPTGAQTPILAPSGTRQDILPVSSMSATETPQNGDDRTETEKRFDAMLAEFIAQRRQKGRETYGKGLDWDDAKYGDKWSLMALEELADAVQYLVAENMRLEREIESSDKALLRTSEALSKAHRQLEDANKDLLQEKYWRAVATNAVLELSEKYQNNK